LFHSRLIFMYFYVCRKETVKLSEVSMRDNENITASEDKILWSMRQWILDLSPPGSAMRHWNMNTYPSNSAVLMA